jgi:CheY-like chemotaxis protein
MAITNCPAVKESSASGSRSPAGPRGVRVLVVDDDPGCTVPLARLLAQDGFDVTTVTSGAEALARIVAQPPDALITDLQMPGLDGASLLHLVHQRFPWMPVIVISGSTQPPAPLLDDGALAYVSKPVDIDDVVSLLDAGVQLRNDRWLPGR